MESDHRSVTYDTSSHFVLWRVKCVCEQDADGGGAHQAASGKCEWVQKGDSPGTLASECNILTAINNSHDITLSFYSF